jgi:hypothetical protein
MIFKPLIFIININFSSFSNTIKYKKTGNNIESDNGYKQPPAILIKDIKNEFS